MAGRADDFDDDDYLPPDHRQASANRLPLALILGLVLGIPILVGVIYFLSARSRQMADRAETVARAQADFAARPTSEAMGIPSANWQRAIGTWQREPAGKGDTNYPYRFEFRPNLTATATSQAPEGNQRLNGGRVEIFVDDRDDLALRLLVADGRYVYRFRFKDDDTLVLTDGADGLVFRRAK